MFYFRDLDKFADNPSSISNLIKSRYKGLVLEEIFVNLSQWDLVPLCPICKTRTRKLKSMRAGFRPTCGEDECISTHRDNKNAEIGNAKAYKFLWKMILENPLEECPVCRTEYYKPETTSKLCCGRKRCYLSVRNGFAGGVKGELSLIIDDPILLHNKAIEIFYEEKNKHRTRNRMKVHCRSKDILDSIMIPNIEGDLERMETRMTSTGILVPVIPESTYIRRLYFKMNLGSDGDYESYMVKEFPESIMRCPYCGEISHVDPSGIVNRSKNKFCSRNHYEKYRKENYDDYFTQTEDQRINASKRMVELIKSGKFTPPLSNSWTRSDPIVVDGIKFKSSWESLFYRLMDGVLCLEYEKVRIPYVDDFGVSRNYIVDFVDVTSGKIFEIKPESQMMRKMNKIKVNAAMQWALDNGVEFVLIHDGWFIDRIDELTSMMESSTLERKEINAINSFKRRSHV